MQTTIQSTSLHFREGNSDKEYHAAIEPRGEGYIVTFAYGRRGNTLTTGIKNDTPVPLETATKLFDKLVASKMAKGYHISSVSAAGSVKPYQQSGNEGIDSGIRCQLLNPVDKEDLSRLLTGRTHCLQEKHDGRRLMVRKQGDEITGINRRGLVVAIPDSIREAVEHIPYDVLIDGEAVGETLHAFDLLEVRGNCLRHRRYPNYRNVIPGYLPQSVPIPETHRAALITWLRSLKGKSNSVRLTWEKPGHMTLPHRDYDTVGATLKVPVSIDGQPPVIAFEPKYLADTLEIGATFRLMDKLNPGMTTGPSGNFCVLMSQRFTEETVTEDAASETPAPAIAA